MGQKFGGVGVLFFFWG